MEHLAANGLVLLISGFEDGGERGGLFRYDGNAVEQLDDVPTTGVTLVDSTVARVVRGRPEERGSTIVVHQEGGPTTLKVEELLDPHDIAWTGSSYAIASAGDNSILYVSPQGRLEDTWRAPGTGDAWHLNSLLLVDGHLCVSAFGRYERHREWADGDASQVSGLVYDVVTGEDVLTGLSAPHHPRRVGPDWIVCNSGRNAVTVLDVATGRPMDELVLGGWTRGLAVLDRYLFVGESPGRDMEEGVTATVAVVDRTTMKVVDRFAVPAREIYDIVAAPAELLPRIGF